MFVVLGGRDSTKVLSIDLLHGELICCEFKDVNEWPSNPPERGIKLEIDLLPNSVPPSKR